MEKDEIDPVEQERRQAETEAAAARSAAAVRVIQCYWRGHYIRIFLGIAPSIAAKSAKEAYKNISEEPLKCQELFKLFVFAVINLACLLVAGSAAISVWVYRINKHPNQVTNYIVWSINMGISVVSTVGIVATIGKFYAWIRGYSFLQIIIICAELSILVALGVTNALEGSEEIKAQAIDNLKDHYCEVVNQTKWVNDELDIDTIVSTGDESICSCLDTACVDEWVEANFRDSVITTVVFLVCQFLLAGIAWTILEPWAQRIYMKRIKFGRMPSRSEKWAEVYKALEHKQSESFFAEQHRLLTTSWYFEGSVAVSVFLLMFVLANQSPAVPPDADTAFALRVIEIFVTVFISMEIAIECVLIVLSNQVNFKSYFTNGWNIVNLYVMCISWVFLIFELLFSTKMEPGNADLLFNAVSASRILRIFRPMKTFGCDPQTDQGIPTSSQFKFELIICMFAGSWKGYGSPW